MPPKPPGCGPFCKWIADSKKWADDLGKHFRLEVYKPGTIKFAYNTYVEKVDLKNCLVTTRDADAFNNPDPNGTIRHFTCTYVHGHFYDYQIT